MDNTKAGFVYVLQMEGLPFYKIGRTVNLTRRLGEISPQMPGRLILVFAHRVRDAWRTESILHDSFRDRRMNGEWFRLDPQCLTEIKALLLCSQAVRLYQRVAHMVSNPDTDTLDCVRYTRALHKAAVRQHRRVNTYLKLGAERFDGDDAEVLNAEFVV